MKFRRINNELWIMESYRHRGSGDALGATCRSRTCQAIIPVGARKRQILNRLRDCHLILVDKLVLSRGLAIARILASLSVTLVLVRPVLIWDLLCHASAARKRLQDAAWIRIMIMDGAVDRYAEMSSLVESTHASEDATRVYAEAVRF